jgi:formylglycine-generating enzyme required for sulfatase activity
VEVSGGTFAQGDATLPVYVRASPVQSMITVSDFAIDACEVTVGRFRRFWAAGHPNPPGTSSTRAESCPGFVGRTTW